jgi:hypothetical protein
MKTLTIDALRNNQVQGFTSREIATVAMDFVQANEASDDARSVLRTACKVIKARVEDTNRKVASRKSSRKVFDQLVAFGMVHFPLPVQTKSEPQPEPEVHVEAEVDTKKLMRMTKAQLVELLANAH